MYLGQYIMQKYADTETVQVAGPQDLSKAYIGIGLGAGVGAGIGALIAAKQRANTAAYIQELKNNPLLSSMAKSLEKMDYRMYAEHLKDSTVLGAGAGVLLTAPMTGTSKDSYFDKVKKLSYGVSNSLHHPMTAAGGLGAGFLGSMIGSKFGLAGLAAGAGLGTGLGSYLTEKYYYGNK